MTHDETVKATKDLLQGITTDDFRVVAIEALRRAKQACAENDVEWFMNGHIGGALVPLLAERIEMTATEPMVQSLKESFLGWQGEPVMQPLTDFMAWFINAGFAFPVYRDWPLAHGYLSGVRLTTAGKRFLDTQGDHVFLPRFVDRVIGRCPQLPEEVGVHLADARTCLDHGLGRPAVVLAGLAYEIARDAAVDQLEAAGKLATKKGRKAAQQITDVKAIIPALFSDLEERGRAWSAWDFADHLRDRRNGASHPRAVPDFSDLTEVQEMLLSAARHLPALWSVRQ